MDAKALRALIKEKIPDGSVVPAHTDEGHFYKVPSVGKTFPSVTGKLQILKDESLISWKMNRALDHVFSNWKNFTDENVMEHLDHARNVSGGILKDATDIGTDIHAYREAYFQKWIDIGRKPDERTVTFIDPSKQDIRAVSAMRALENFVTDTNYEPVLTEQLVYDTRLEVAGTLDDVGIMDKILRPFVKECEHSLIHNNDMDVTRCLKCEGKKTREFVLMDLKSSNQFKDHYFFQVAMYCMMFVKLTKIKPKRCFILKLSKEDGSYKIEDLKKLTRLEYYAKNMLRTHDGLQMIKALRKDNQKTVLKV